MHNSTRTGKEYHGKCTQCLTMNTINWKLLNQLLGRYGYPTQLWWQIKHSKTRDMHEWWTISYSYDMMAEKDTLLTTFTSTLSKDRQRVATTFVWWPSVMQARSLSEYCQLLPLFDDLLRIAKFAKGAITLTQMTRTKGWINRNHIWACSNCSSSKVTTTQVYGLSMNFCEHFCEPFHKHYQW